MGLLARASGFPESVEHPCTEPARTQRGTERIALADRGRSVHTIEAGTPCSTSQEPGWMLRPRSYRITCMRQSRGGRGAMLRLAALALCSLPLAAQTDYVADVKFAIDEVEKQCADLLRSKKIDWRKATASMLADAEYVKSDGEHWVLLTRLLARLQDGHCAVQKLPKAGNVEWPADPRGEKTGVGMFWCLSDGKVYIKSVWNVAEKAGLTAGMEVV